MSDQIYEGPAYQDFFSPFVGYGVYTLPDGLQTITFKIMSEGERMEYQRKTNRPINIDRKNDTASIKPDLAQDRYELIRTSVTDWTLVRRDPDSGEWLPVVFTKANLDNWIKSSNPKIISALEKEVQKANPWMQAEMSIEDIQAEIDSLQELLTQRLNEEAEKNS